MNLANAFTPYSVTPLKGSAVAQIHFDLENFIASMGIDLSSSFM